MDFTEPTDLHISDSIDLESPDFSTKQWLF